MKLINELIKQGRLKDACDEGLKDLIKARTKEELIELFFKYIIFCLKNNYPDNSLIKAHFKGLLEERGIYIDEAFNVQNKPKCVCLGATKGKIEVADYEVCDIFVKHESQVTINVKDNAFAMIDVFDKAKVAINASDRAKVCVNHYGGVIEDNTADNAVIKIREKNKTT